MKNILNTSVLILLIFLIHLVISCKKETTALPVVTTTAVTEISYTTALSGGNVISKGGAPLTSSGICWNTSVNPTVDNNRTSENVVLGPFTSHLTQLSSNTTYYIRAYASNTGGTGYGDQITFSTQQVEAPTLITTEITSTTQSTATCGGNITSDGGTTITARGVCWNTSSNPTLSDNKTTDGSGPGCFTSNLTGLNSNTTYYFKAYATNSSGTSYGNEISFITGQCQYPPTAITNNATSVRPVSVYLNGTVNGNSQSTTVLFEYGITTSYGHIVDNPHYTILGSGEYPISESLTNLTPGTLYHYRVKAESLCGLTYGNDITFTTSEIAPINFNPNLTYGSVSDIDGNSYKTIQIGTQTWMAENLKTTKYSDGTNIPKGPDNSWGNLRTPGYCWYNNDEYSFKAAYGALYNWYTVDIKSNGDKNLCPTGWHVPTNPEFNTLITYLGGMSVAGGKLKESGLTHWMSPNMEGSNESGFTALPGGNPGALQFFFNLGGIGYWWSSTESTSLNGWDINIWYSSGGVTKNTYYKEGGYSVRCLKDNK